MVPSPPAVPAVPAVLLAAGGGTRFAGPGHKLLARLGDRSVIAHAATNAARSGLSPLVVVTGAVDVRAELPANTIVLANPDWDQGQATSLAVATAWARAEAWAAIVVGLADQPGVPPAAWQAVAAADTTPIAVATYGGRRGHPVRLAATIWDRLPTSGDTGARVLMARLPEL